MMNTEKKQCWVVDPKDRSTIYSEVEPFIRPSDDFRVCGVYHKAGVPFIISEVDYKPVSDTCFEALKDDNPMLITGSLLRICSRDDKRNATSFGQRN